LQAAAVFIVALVRQWREKLVQQIAVRAVELYSLQSDPLRSFCGGDECVAYAR